AVCARRPRAAVPTRDTRAALPAAPYRRTRVPIPEGRTELRFGRAPPSAPAGPIRLPAPGRATAASGGRLLPVRRDERAHAIGGLRALAYPIIDARQVELQLRLPAVR